MEEMQENPHDVEHGHQAGAGAGAQPSSQRDHGSTIHFTVDGEPFTTDDRTLTANEIIRRFAEKDPATHYLILLRRKKKESFQGRGDETIRIKEGDQFMTICVGPTPVADGTRLTGVGAFIAGLKELGWGAEMLPGHPDHVLFDYTVESGKFAGRTFRLGFQVPPDFPMSEPHGPHLSPRIHPNGSGGEHPTGGIHDSPTFAGATGQEWEHWSRPHPNWSKKPTVAEYMRHIWQLWDTQ